MPPSPMSPSTSLQVSSSWVPSPPACPTISWCALSTKGSCQMIAGTTLFSVSVSFALVCVWPGPGEALGGDRPLGPLQRHVTHPRPTYVFWQTISLGNGMQMRSVLKCDYFPAESPSCSIYFFVPIFIKPSLNAYCVRHGIQTLS